MVVAIEFRYKRGLTNVIDEEQRYHYDKLVFGYYHVYDDIKLTNWELSARLSLPLSFKAFGK